MMDHRKRYALSTFGLFALVIVAVRIMYVLRSVAWLAPYIPIIVAVTLIYVPLLYAKWKRDPIDYIDRTWKQWRASLRLFLMTCVIVVPPFLILNHYWQFLVYGLHFQAHPLPVFGWVVIDQLFLVSVPEEIFFRGWFQSRLHHLFRARWRVLGVRVGWSWLLTALLFALAHSLVTYQWWHFSIFIPALLFGWMREKTGTIAAPVLFHCVCNLIAFWVGFNYS